ncbi:MAG TPA: carbamoyl-phosphate synthase large subunit, partial [Planctomycetota bacterium]|nr:carbamoyl-phosphate synthase large subunit [Planctomycetota bacterium]
NRDVIDKAEDRDRFRRAIVKIGLEVPRSGLAHTMEEARAVRQSLGLPVVIRPAYTLGGTGGGIAYNIDEFEQMAAWGLRWSRISEILIEESVVGWKEFELEVMRDKKDNVVIVCSIENFDPMGVHTGDSITVAPVQTLTDKEYQRMRDAAIAIIREIGVETGGSNIQFATDPADGRMVVIEMNPRVSRSSALASKATGFPIAKFAAKLAVGYTLDEIPNDITRETPASFEPTLDYCVVKFPRWAFEKFQGADSTLTIQMKSVGETMAIGRTFKEALQKAIRSLEISRFGLGWDTKDRWLRGESIDPEEIRHALITPSPERIFAIRYAIRQGMDIAEINQLTKIDPWFLHNIEEIVDMEDQLARYGSPAEVPDELFHEAKRFGFSDVQLAAMWKSTEDDIRADRDRRGIRTTFKCVDTCAAEFEAYTPYFYSTWETEDESPRSDRKKVVILGSGPNRIGQGIEFDYCCVHAAMALKEAGYETIMVNSNPETVSTDYDVSDQLYFEPLTLENVLAICERQKPEGVIVQLGGQTPLNLCSALHKAGVKILGTSPESIDRSEDREQFGALIDKLGLLQPTSGIAYTVEQCMDVAKEIGFPVLVRPSFVLGGRAMQIVYDTDSLATYMALAVDASPGKPVLIDKFLEDAIEVDVDAISDGRRVVIGGIMEHIEEAGIHSGDSSCILPPQTLTPELLEQIRRATRALARELDVRGLMNVQYAVRNNTLYVLEVNPRASRTIPFVSKATGVPLAKLAAKVMVGMTLDQLGLTQEVKPRHTAVKAVVLPYTKFPECDIRLGPEMRSTGEVMGIDDDYGLALAKAQISTSQAPPLTGKVVISVKDRDKPGIGRLAKKLRELGFSLAATAGTYGAIRAFGVELERINKLSEGRPNILDSIKNREIALVINTPAPGNEGPRTDGSLIRTCAVTHGIPCITTLQAAWTVVEGITALKQRDYRVKALQDYHPTVGAGTGSGSGSVTEVKAG